jgi:hydrogenase expression/formation protein HypC
MFGSSSCRCAGRASATAGPVARQFILSHKFKSHSATKSRKSPVEEKGSRFEPGAETSRLRLPLCSVFPTFVRALTNSSFVKRLIRRKRPRPHGSNRQFVAFGPISTAGSASFASGYWAVGARNTTRYNRRKKWDDPDKHFLEKRRLVCLAVPGRVVRWLRHDSPFCEAEIDFLGVRRVCNLSCVPEAQIDDYVIVHAGVAITRVDAEAARQTLFELGSLDHPDILESFNS